MKRALSIRVAALEAEQRADAHEFESLRQRGNDLLAGMQERQARLRRFRELLINGWRVA